MLDTPCGCTKLRRATRSVTKFYDEAIAASGLKITQFSLMRTVLRMGEHVSISELAKATGLDRSTLGRNLRVMGQSGWVDLENGEDLRARFVSVTPEGKRCLEVAVPLWENAQTHFSEVLGNRDRETLFRLLTKLEAARP